MMEVLRKAVKQILKIAKKNITKEDKNWEQIYY